MEFERALLWWKHSGENQSSALCAVYESKRVLRAGSIRVTPVFEPAVQPLSVVEDAELEQVAPGHVFRSRKVTATVLQPGRYGHVRSGQTVAATLAKYLQNSRISGRSSTG